MEFICQIVTTELITFAVVLWALTIGMLLASLIKKD